MRFNNSDGDALKTLGLSLMVMTLSGSLTYQLLLARVLLRAWRTPCGQKGHMYLLFGKKLKGGGLDRDYRARLERLLALPRQPVILMGGFTGKAPLSEARVGYDYLLRRGHPPQLLHLEQGSTNTLENLKNARAMLQERGETLALIISNRYHLNRCSVMANNLAIAHALCAAEPRFWPSPRNLVRCLAEAFYVHWFMSGKLWAMLTRNHRMLSKIS